MASEPNRLTLRQVAGNVLFVAGCALVATSFVRLFADPILFGGGILLVIASHFLYPFQNQLARLRRAPISAPSHEQRSVDRKAQRGKDAI